MVEQHKDSSPHSEALRNSERSQYLGLLEEYLIEKEIHNHLRFLERHVDANLLLERFKERLKKQQSAAKDTITGQAGGLTNPAEDDGRFPAGEYNPEHVEYLLNLLENEPEVVETAFRRRMVADAYADLERPEFIDKLNHAPEDTERLIVGMRRDLHEKQTGEFSAALAQLKQAAEKHAAAEKQTKNTSSLLSRVLCQTSHPQLAASQPSPWKEVVNDGPDLKIMIRSYKDKQEKISFRLEGIVAAPLICILSVLNEVDLFSNWVPYFTTPFKLGLREVTNERLGRVDQVVQFHIDFPWPFANRDACFEVFAVDDFERNSQVVVKMLTLDDQQRTPRQKMTIPPPGRRVERIVVDGSLVIRPLTPTSSSLSLLWHENCRMRVPLMMADFVTKLFARSAFQAFRKTCESAIEGPWKVRRAENGFLYSFIQQRLQEVHLDVAGVYSPAAENNEEFFDAKEKSGTITKSPTPQPEKPAATSRETQAATTQAMTTGAENSTSAAAKLAGAPAY
ncbi:hypothetical protein ACSSS7_000464 [Eimeria intestinalis]